jgi:Domain of unknown function (DUF5671)
MTSELREFVRDALAHGMPRGEIREKLLAAGWRAEEVQTALDSFAEIESPVPVPRRRPYLSARETFFYLVLFVTLFLTAINVGTVLFQLVNRAIPEVAGGASSWDRFSADATRGAVAAILIGFPIFLFMSRLIGEAIARDPEKRASKIRKWLTYITLFVSACVIIGDLTFLVTQVLSGELVLRIGLKVLTVFVIAGVIFVHYLSDLRREEDRAQLGPAKPSGLARVAGVAVLATLITGLFLAGSPRQERLRKIDAKRVDDLTRISWGVRGYYQEHRVLPGSLAIVAELPSSNVNRITDPVTGVPYGYRIVDSTRYELSARFDTVDSTLDRVGLAVGESRFWRHGAGPTTYTLTLPPKPLESPAARAPRRVGR